MYGGVRSNKSWGEQSWALPCSNETLLTGSVNVCIVHFPAFSYLYGNREQRCLGGAAGCSYRVSFGIGQTGGAGWVEKHQDPLLQAQLGVLRLKEGGMRPQSSRVGTGTPQGHQPPPGNLLGHDASSRACSRWGCRREAAMQLIAPEALGRGSQGCGFAVAAWE